MAKQFQSIEPNHHTFIQQQRIFFAASAAAEGRVNVSPKEAGSLAHPQHQQGGLP